MANCNVRMDSMAQVGVTPNHPQHAMNIRTVCDIEKELDMMEKVSLIFLLYDDVEVARQHLFQLQNGATLEVIVEWASYAIKVGGNWQDKLLESLAIVQNFHVIHKLGYNKNEICDRFLPRNSETSLFIDRYKKKLYHICDKMTNAQMETFLKHVKDDFNRKNLVFEDFPIPYMEMFLVYWTSIKYISPTDLSNLSKAFKVMEMYDISESLTKPKFTNNLVRSTNYTDNSNNNNAQLHSRLACIDPEHTWNNYENQIYHIDRNCPGICLIINQEVFYIEPDPQLSSLLPTCDLPLGRRDGTNVDRDSLKDTFEMLGYSIVIRENLTHDEILEVVTETVNMVRNHSSLIVCILSHGLEGKVFGVNCITVNISQIREIICSVNTKYLRTKPKVMILQCCQGTECLWVSDGEDDEPEEKVDVENLQTKVTTVVKQPNLQYDNERSLQMDGGSRPKTADVLLFWATVPGFGAVRHVTEGSWFIQSLCKHIKKKAHQMHFEDICTLVKQEVIDMRWKTRKLSRAMVPNKESTLSQFFFLLPMDKHLKN